MIPPCTHAREDECSFVLEGEMKCYVDGEVVLAQKAPTSSNRGEYPAFYNTGAGTVRVMEILTPGSAFEGYDEYEEIVSRHMSDEEHLRAQAELGERYGITLARRTHPRGRSQLRYPFLTRALEAGGAFGPDRGYRVRRYETYGGRVLGRRGGIGHGQHLRPELARLVGHSHDLGVSLARCNNPDVDGLDASRMLPHGLQ